MILDLPSQLIVEILSRLTNSGDLAVARLSSKTLRSLSLSIPSISLRCSRRRSLLLLPFKTLVLNNLSLLSSSSSSQTLTSLSIGIDKIDDGEEEIDEEEDGDGDRDADDLHLTAVDFVAGVVEIVGGRLRSLEIDDYWVQSCWRRSGALAIISDGCGNLLKLVVRNAWLSVEGLKPMPKLTKLTLEFIRLDDEHLDKVNECFPSLQVLNLIGVVGLKEPKIHLSQLKILVLETPLLSHLDLKIRKPASISIFAGLSNLKAVLLESPYLCSLAKLLSNKSVEKLVLSVPESIESDEQFEAVTIMDLVSAFPNINDLTLGPELQMHGFKWKSTLAAMELELNKGR